MIGQRGTCLPRRVETRCITHEKSHQTLPGAELHPEHPGHAPASPGELQEARASGAPATPTSFLSQFRVRLLHTIPSSTSPGFKVSPKSCRVHGEATSAPPPWGRWNGGTSGCSLHLATCPAPAPPRGLRQWLRWGQRVHVTPDAPPSVPREGSGAPREPRAAPSPRRGYIWCRICIAASRRTWAAGEILGGARARGAAGSRHTRGKESPSRRLFIAEPASLPGAEPPPCARGGWGGMGTMLCGRAVAPWPLLVPLSQLPPAPDLPS